MKNNETKKTFLSDLLFYGILLSLVIAVLAISGSSASGPKVLGGYSAFVVLTGSMEDEIPKGSLVVTKSIDAGDLQVGDDITYMVSETTTVTHRIIEIINDYPYEGDRGFRTQGVMNAEPDRNPVAAVNVVGKVIWHHKTLGVVVSYAQGNWPLLIFFIVVILLFAKIVEKIIRKEPEYEKLSEEQRIDDLDDIVIEIIDL